jgi:hypothetical protein
MKLELENTAGSLDSMFSHETQDQHNISIQQQALLSQIEGCLPSGSKMSPGTIRKVNSDGTYEVHFDDGGQDPAVTESSIQSGGGASSSLEHSSASVRRKGDKVEATRMVVEWPAVIDGLQQFSDGSDAKHESEGAQLSLQLLKYQIHCDPDIAAHHFVSLAKGEAPSAKLSELVWQREKHPLPSWYANYRLSGDAPPMHIQYLGMHRIHRTFRMKKNKSGESERSQDADEKEEESIWLRIQKEETVEARKRSKTGWRQAKRVLKRRGWGTFVFVVHVLALIWMVVKDTGTFNPFGKTQLHDFGFDDDDERLSENTALGPGVERILAVVQWMATSSFRLLVFVAFIHTRYVLNKTKGFLVQNGFLVRSRRHILTVFYDWWKLDYIPGHVFKTRNGQRNAEDKHQHPPQELPPQELPLFGESTETSSSLEAFFREVCGQPIQLGQNVEEKFTNDLRKKNDTWNADTKSFLKDASTLTVIKKRLFHKNGGIPECVEESRYLSAGFMFLLQWHGFVRCPFNWFARPKQGGQKGKAQGTTPLSIQVKSEKACRDSCKPAIALIFVATAVWMILDLGRWSVANEWTDSKIVTIVVNKFIDVFVTTSLCTVTTAFGVECRVVSALVKEKCRHLERELHLSLRTGHVATQLDKGFFSRRTAHFLEIQTTVSQCSKRWQFVFKLYMIAMTLMAVGIIATVVALVVLSQASVTDRPAQLMLFGPVSLFLYCKYRGHLPAWPFQVKTHENTTCCRLIKSADDAAIG